MSDERSAPDAHANGDERDADSDERGAAGDGRDADSSGRDTDGGRDADGSSEAAVGETAVDARTDGGREVDTSAERPTVPPRRYSSFERGSLSWLLQRITAGFLVVVLAFHFFLLHFVNHAFEIDFAGSSMRMQELGYSVTMVLFLVTATFHGVNGVYNALINQGLDGRQKTVVKWVLVVAGVALVVQGIRLTLALAAG